MTSIDATRRNALLALAAIPAGAMLLGPAMAAQKASQLVVFNGKTTFAGPGIDVVVFGWAAQTADGWIGQTVDAATSVAKREQKKTRARRVEVFEGWTAAGLPSSAEVRLSFRRHCPCRRREASR